MEPGLIAVPMTIVFFHTATKSTHTWWFLCPRGEEHPFRTRIGEHTLTYSWPCDAHSSTPTHPLAEVRLASAKAPVHLPESIRHKPGVRFPPPPPHFAPGISRMSRSAKASNCLGKVRAQSFPRRTHRKIWPHCRTCPSQPAGDFTQRVGRRLDAACQHFGVVLQVRRLVSGTPGLTPTSGGSRCISKKTPIRFGGRSGSRHFPVQSNPVLMNRFFQASCPQPINASPLFHT